MSQAVIARMIGAAITAWLVASVAKTAVRPSEPGSTERFAVYNLLLFFSAAGIAYLFSLPRVPGTLYVNNGVIASLVMAITMGIKWISVDTDLYPKDAFLEGFTIHIVSPLLGWVIGGVILMWIRRERNDQLPHGR